MTIYVDFEPVGRRGNCPEGATLLDSARQLGVELVSLCGGVGTCGRCRVQILIGDVSEPLEAEKKFLTEEELDQGFRLACCTVPLSDCRVRVPPESLSTPQRTQVEGEEVAVAPEPPVKVYQIALEAPSLEDLCADADRLQRVLRQDHGVAVTGIDVAVLRGLSPRLREASWQLAAALRDGEIVSISATSSRSLGLAVDLGTTKLAGYLLDLETGRTLTSAGRMNPQIAYGEDVVARMSYACQSPEQAIALQTLVAQALNDLASTMCAEVGAKPSEIVEAVVVGNTAMHHLFLRLPVEQLANAPYVPAVASELDVKARDLGLDLAPGAYVHLLPNIAGYVGGDHVAMLLATGMYEVGGVVLALDIGTNTEVCLANQGRLTSLSCASGPAFEGAQIKYGMRAAQGAIERLRLVDGRIEYQTIGGVPPVGLCGSGILDALAQLYEAGVVNARGKLLDHPRVRGDGAEREFVLVADNGLEEGRPAITFTQKDVRELQLAKGAMRTGIQVLLEVNGLAAEAVDQVLIAGAFGSYIDIESAMSIGMLPPLPAARFRQVGNAAGMGAKLALVSMTKRAEAASLARRVEYVELATTPSFMKTFVQSMYLGRDLF